MRKLINLTLLLLVSFILYSCEAVTENHKGAKKDIDAEQAFTSDFSADTDESEEVGGPVVEDSFGGGIEGSVVRVESMPTTTDKFNVKMIAIEDIAFLSAETTHYMLTDGQIQTSVEQFKSITEEIAVNLESKQVQLAK